MTGPLVIAAETQLNDKLKVDLLNNRKVHVAAEPVKKLTATQITTPKSSHVFPIHFQPARGHQVTPNEFHNLHLVWYQGCIFVKPIPPYLFSAAFWEWITEADPDIFKAAAGFMRSYTFLIRSETDYRLANDEKVPLLPFGMENTTDGFERFSRFINQFSQLTDDQVSPRYSYGELRLRRLNWLIRILGIKVTYFHMHGEWGTVFMDMLAPLVAIFAVLSIFLAAMQVGLAADPSISEAPARTYAVVCYWFSVVVLLATGTASLGFLGLMVGVYIYQQVFAYKMYNQRCTTKAPLKQRRR
ncbi:hypothetical protein CHGG_00148 [Chaetomium globosum CBS 148.51]|uniref:Uncharacterized protein n=1 Tax=Chaetomium globosum (strain ATCC 6205 / CBS 148.51 / DSM 1962 / NBRC 6347 / NRRL 1970) TaxID=306901 RepID=Q2HI06_CHAGB|nr:uncharacterized protein CHGG_00148 [Chaetomium globosum CBS 148.51]EAQ91913.1 hypothetical protein CHGG_00148 [Chaetomium globosum CBS 148.51]